jgi:hypothetical protein
LRAFFSGLLFDKETNTGIELNKNRAFSKGFLLVKGPIQIVYFYGPLLIRGRPYILLTLWHIARDK